MMAIIGFWLGMVICLVAVLWDISLRLGGYEGPHGFYPLALSTFGFGLFTASLSMLILSEVQVRRLRRHQRRQASLIVAGGWCAPSDQIWDVPGTGIHPQGLSFTASPGGLRFVGERAQRPPKPAPEPLPAAPAGAPAGHWEFGVLDPDADIDEAWCDWDYYGQDKPYRTPEEAREGEHFRPGAEIVRRWQPDALPFEKHVPITEEHEDD